MEITPITLPLAYRMGWVNCYLVRTGADFILIDTGGKNNRQELEERLSAEGVTADNLRLILITHGDFDHTGNAAHLKRAFGTPIGMSPLDASMVEKGDMFANRQEPNSVIRLLGKLLFRFGSEERFTPDVALKDGDSLSNYGMDARLVAIPGHSRGSIGVLSTEGSFFCGDLLDNTRKPVLNSLIDDAASAVASLEMVQSLPVKVVYPGHGDPFALEALS